MRNLQRWTFIVSMFICYAYVCDAACPSNWLEYDGDCYLIVTARYNYMDQEALCANRNATMYVFHNEKQWAWVNSQLIHGYRMEFYVGLQRVNKTWTWVDNTTYDVNATHWYRNQVGGRDDARHRCATMYSYRPHQGKVHQVDCYGGQGVICVKPRASFELCNTADGWKLLENQCMKLFEDKSTWQDANNTCTKKDATLLRPQTRRELYALGELINCSTTTNQMWLDVSDVPYPGRYVYSNNQTIRHYFWTSYGNRLLTKGGTCVYANRLQNYYFDSGLCTEEKKFVCTKATGTCPDGWAQHINQCYQLVSVPKVQDTWFGAKQYCSYQNTQLLTIYSADEETFIQNMMVSQPIQRIWLGFSDRDTPDQLVWVDGTTVANNYTHWDIAYPKLTKNRTDCGILQAGRGSSAWSNAYCFTSLPFVCKGTITTDIDPMPTAPPGEHCDPGWVLYNGQCYYFGASQNSSGYNWHDAQRFCYANNADLTTIQDEDEQAFIIKNLLSTGSSWIGLRYSPVSRGLFWVDQTSPGFMNFYPGEPDDLGKGEDCMQIVGGRQDFTGAWDDGNCSVQQDFICKKISIQGGNPNATVPPTTLGAYSFRCGAGWIFNSLDGFCYQIVVGRPKSFANAQWACQQMGSNLLSITDPREQRYIQAILNTDKYLRITSNYWIGGSDASQEGGWTWIDGSAFAYLNWHPGEPNDRMLAPSGEDCVEMVPSWNYQWNDKRCDKEQNYICKKAAVPLSTTIQTPTAGPVMICGNEPMISGNYSILDGDTSLTASTTRDSGHGPFNSRLYITGLNGNNYANTPGWSAATTNQGEWIQVYFYNLLTVKGIITAGKPDGAEWVTKFRIRYQYDYYSQLVWYEEPPGTVKIFDGNTDNTSPKTNVIQFPFQAKYVRLYPLQWNNAISLRWEVTGCVQEFCLSDYAISGPLVTDDSSLTASSISDSAHGPGASRLHPIHPQASLSAWRPNPSEKNSYIQVDLGSVRIIRGITTAGNPNAQEWTSSYRIYYGSKPNLVTSYYQEPYKSIKVFDGNVNNNETRTHYFKGHFQARYIKVEPEAFVGAIALRFDIIVCPKGCDQRTLLANLDDDQFSASSANDNQEGPSQSRLNQPAVAGGSNGAWIPRYQNTRQWIQADLEAMIQITAIATQGRAGHDEYVTQYKIATSSDGQSFGMYSAFQRDAIVFAGNFDDSSVRKHFLALPLITRYIRIYPMTYHKRLALRWEVYGCPGPDSGTLLGCFADDKLSRDLSFEPYGNAEVGMWPPMCVHHCFSKGYYYAGLQNRYMCFCGNSYGKYGSSNQCNMPCYTRPNFNCGGTNANAIYTTGLTPVNKVCPPTWQAYLDKCYLLLLNTTTWLNARQDCKQFGGDLATVNSQAEQDLVYTIMSNKGAADMWIGLNDRQESNFFEWVNGEVSKYTNWNVNQPANINTLNENCVLINKTNGGWQDQNCEEQHQYLCMRAKMGSNKPTLPPQYPGCDIGWVGYRWSCYLIMEQPRSFILATQACNSRGGTLVQIDDRYEQAFLASSLSGKTGLYWTDVTNIGTRGYYQNFDTKQEVQYTNWAPGRPGSAVSCVALQTTAPAGLWVDSTCVTQAGAICEKLGQGQTTPRPPTTTPAPTPCPTGWFEINKFCYQVNNVSGSHQLPYSEANKDCIIQGASLASFHNSSDFDNLWRNKLVGVNSNFWIGINALTLVNGKRQLTWTDRTPLNFVNWAPNQPDNYKGREDCGEIWSSNGLWNDADCSFHRNWICMVAKGASVRSRQINRAPSPGQPGSCPGLINWQSYNGHCYILQDGSGNNAKTWREARRWCQQYSADLISITSTAEQLFAQYLAANISSYTVWTGFSEIDYEYGYRWSDGSVPAFVNWNNGEPNDYAGAEDCVEMVVYNGKWNDAHCAEKKGFICEKIMGVIQPTTATPVMSGNCPSGFRANRNKCYRVYNTPKSWDDANTACQALGGRKKGYYLASVSNIFENAFLTTLLQNSGVEPWIGLKQRSDNQFYWVDNTEVTYTNWDQGQPNMRSQSCVQIYSALHNAGHWATDVCSLLKGYVCATNKKVNIRTPEAIPNPCPSGSVSYGTDCFLYVPTPATWSAAQQDCRTKSSYLATVADPFEQSFLFLFINAPTVAKKSSVWIGLNDASNTGSYSWTQPQWSVAYTNWDNGQPHRAVGGGCVSANVSGQWWDTPCNQPLPYVCKSTSATPPATPPGPNGKCRSSRWIFHNNKCYSFHYAKPLSFIDATINCTNDRSTMVSVHSMEENKFLLTTLKTYSIQSEGFWLGLHKSPSGFEWSDRSTTNFINWDSGQPSGKDQRGNAENCGELRSWNGKWNDLDCSELRGYVCVNQPILDTTDLNTPSVATNVATPTKFPSPPTITPPLPTKPNTGGQTLPTPGGNSGPTKKGGITIPRVTGTLAGSTVKIIQEKQYQKKGLGAGGVIGIVIAAIIVLAVPTVGLIFWKRQRPSTTTGFDGGIDNASYQLDPKQNGDTDKTENES